MISGADIPTTPLSAAQERLWFQWRLRPDCDEYNVAKAVRLRGRLDMAALRWALRALTRRHTVLRATFPAVDGSPVVRTGPAEPVPTTVADIRDVPVPERERMLAGEVDRAVRAPFDLSRGPLFRAHLVRLADDDQALVLAFHHIVTDGVSMGILDCELPVLYRAGAQGAPDPLPPLPRQYQELAAAQARRAEEGAYTEALAYWRRELDAAPSRSALPGGAPERAPGGGPCRHTVPLPREVADRVDAIAAQHRATRFLVSLSAYAALLALMSSADDVVVGVPVHGRGSREEEAVFGLFVNMLPLRVRTTPGMTFADLIASVRDAFLAGLEFHDTPFQLLVDEVRAHRSASHHPLFQTVFAYEEPPAEETPLPGLEVRELPVPARTAVFDLTVNLLWRAEAPQVRWDYRPGAYDAATVASAAGRYITLLAAAVASPGTPLTRLPLLCPGEEQRILDSWSRGETAGTAAQEPVARLVEEHARASPEAPAVRTASTSLTYGELDRAADEVAAGLRAAGAGPGTLVATRLPRGTQLVTALLGIVKSGAAYVPLDPAQPPSRVGAVLDETQPVVLLAETAGTARGVPARTVDAVRRLGSEAPAPASCSPAAVTGAAGGEHPAYVIYTSGSTGRPKGVVVGHRSLANLVSWHHRRFGIGPGDRTTMLASPGFDASAWEIWAALTAGATLEVPPDETLLSPTELCAWLTERQVTSAFIPTPLLQRMVEQPWPPTVLLRSVLTGGDRLHTVGDRPLPFQVVNNYGPTEATVVATSGAVDTADPAAPPIGRPLPGVAAYVLDRELRPVPAGVTGELYLGGDGLALGYLRQPALTADRFVPDPFARAPGARLYRTGDLVRWRPEGVLDYVGRGDAQLSVRGFRIEPGDVEHALRTHAAVSDSVVIAHEGDLAACLVLAAQARAPDTAELTGHLTRLLPRYMCPRRYLRLAALPLTAHGKVDRARLPHDAVPLAPSRAARWAQGPRSAVECLVAEAWAAALGHTDFEGTSNFFDVGGHSMLLASVAERLSDALGRPVPIAGLYEHPTPSALARHLDSPGDGPSGSAHPPPALRTDGPHRSSGPRTGQPRAGSVAALRAACLRRPGSRDIESGMPPLSERSHVRRIAVTGAATGAIDEADIDTQIAVVGMACRFPGSRTPEEYWHNLVHGVDSIRDITARELAEWGEDPARLDEPRYVAAHGVVEGGGGLDARFFGITDRDAALLNPQHKVFLELAWEALERAGYDPRDAPEPVGVFAGTSRNGYGLLVHSLPDRFPGIDDVDLSLANEPEHLVTRVSYLLGLTGPSLAVQTACSTSLVAVHEASRALIGGECDTALAGGVSLRLPLHGYWHRGGGTMSPDGRCRAFSADARGIVGGDGAGVVVLRRLQDALEDGDHVHAVLLGTAVNNDGRHRAGYAAPGVRGQAEVVRSAHLAAGVTSSSVSYIEAHGTGTPVGDPIEVAALTQAFADHDGSAPVAIGSVKTNIGHTDAAAGVASLIKTVLALENQTLPATLHFDQPNPRIDFSDGLFVVNSATRVWTTGHLPRRAGVSSFGIGGTNAHAVLEAAPAPAGDKAAWGPEAHLLVLSARTPTALRAASARLAGHLRDHPEQSLGDIAHTLQRGRHAFGHRRHVVCAGRDDAVRAFTADSAVPAAEAGTDPSAVFVFPSGSQDGGEPLSIARLLTAATGLTFFSAFRAAVDTCHEALEHTGLDLLGLWPADETAGDGLPERAALLFAVEYATACLLRDWDVVPAAVTGYGTGALVAACVSGALPLADAVTLAVGPEDDAQRGEAIRKAPWTSPAIPVADPATGTLLTPQQAADGTAWAARLSAQPEDRGLPSAVRALRALAEQPQSVLLEVGPGRVLTDTAHRDGLTASAEILPCLPHVLPDGNTLPDGNAGADERGLVSLLDAAGRLWVAGARIRWEGLHEGARRRRVPLPTYPFERQEYLVRPAPWSAAAPAEPAAEDQEPLSVRDGLRTLFQQVLGVPEDVEDPDFFAYGGDSLSAVSLLALVEARFGAALDMEDVFTQATVGALAAVIEERLGAGADPVESS